MICADRSLLKLRDISERCRLEGVKLIGCNVLGVCGYVYNDFLDRFEVTDIDGETPREVKRMIYDIVNYL